MKNTVPESEYPFWVKMGTWRMPTRASIWKAVGVGLLVAVMFAVLTAVDKPENQLWCFVGMINSLLLAFLYWNTIMWIDRNGTWARSRDASSK